MRGSNVKKLEHVLYELSLLKDSARRTLEVAKSLTGGSENE